MAALAAPVEAARAPAVTPEAMIEWVHWAQIDRYRLLLQANRGSVREAAAQLGELVDKALEMVRLSADALNRSGGPGEPAAEPLIRYHGANRAGTGL